MTVGGCRSRRRRGSGTRDRRRAALRRDAAGAERMTRCVVPAVNVPREHGT